MEQSKFYQIKNVTECEYTLVGCDGSVITRPIQEVDKIASSFTIQDAKDGDVLVSPATKEDKECPFIFKEIDKNGVVRFHAALLQNKDLEISNDVSNVIGYANAGYHVPATKEQRDLLFQKMKEAGYEWDAEKKELKKIEQKYAWGEEDEEIARALNDYVKNLDILFSKINIGGKDVLSKEFREKVQHWLKSLKDRVQPKKEWSEEDDRKFQLLIAMCDETKGDSATYSTMYREMEELKSWLKSLKERVLPQKQEWSEEDEQYLLICKNALAKYQVSDKWDAVIISQWLESRLKSLRPQSRWKLSEEQMKALESIFAKWRI